MPMTEDAILTQMSSYFAEEHNKPLLNSLTLHRGWHRYNGDPSSKSRPIENTRQAYVDAVAIGNNSCPFCLQV
jgi:hypothetical protein